MRPGGDILVWILAVVGVVVVLLLLLGVISAH